MTLRAVIAGAALLASAGWAQAVLPGEQLSDPKLEARARAISQELRCVVCQNETIDDSDAPLAHDLRVVLRERLKAGDSDAQAVDFIVRRYGSFVLLKPPFRGETFVLWLGPLFVLVAGGLGVALYLRRRGDLAATALSVHEETQIEELLNTDGGA
jgi:cytochrome c-type biogenesis protein CcmH